MEKSDQELVSDYLNGNEAAFEVLVGRHLQAIYNFVRHLCGGAKDAEDITQESFVKVWRNLKKYKPGLSFRAWLFRIARNTAFDWLRRKKDLSFSSFEHGEDDRLFEDIVDPGPLPDELFARSEAKEFLASALGELSPWYREILILRYAERLTFEEIGQTLQKSVNTVKSRHRRALAELRKLLLSKPVNSL